MNFDYERERQLFELEDDQKAAQRRRGYLSCALRDSCELTAVGSARHRYQLDQELRAVDREIARRAVKIANLERFAHSTEEAS